MSHAWTNDVRIFINVYLYGLFEWELIFGIIKVFYFV